MFGRVDDRIIADLTEIVGESRIRTDPAALEEYGRDETPGLFSPPGAAVFPADSLHVARILEAAARENVPVTARGGGTGLAGGAVPAPGGIVLVLTGMDRLVEIDEENLTATVEAGMVTERFRNAVEAVGLYYPPDPASLDSCTIGGNLATGAGGARALRYGTTRDYVLGVEAVVPAAGTVVWGGKPRKNASGYNLARLLVGSEGTLGVVVKAVLRLLPLPPERVTLWASFPDLERAAAAVAPLLKSGAEPAALELLDRGSLEAAARVEDAGLGRGGEAFLLVELEGREGTELPWEETGKICAEAGAADVLVAEDRGLRDRIWKTRRAVTEGLRLLSPVHAKQDVSVPPAAIPAFIRRARAAAREERLDAVCFGHAGDGNIHLNLLGAGVPEAEWPERKTRAERRILEEALALGGVISGEHGIGLVKRAYLGLGYSPPAIDLMKALKRACDPRGILNPGKIFP